MRENVEMLVISAAARVLANRFAPSDALWLTAQIASSLSPPTDTDATPHKELRRRALAITWRASSRLPGHSDCYDRAISARLWLALHGDDGARVVFGLRREGSWEGHAWLDLGEGGSMFVDEALGYREIAREPIGLAPERAGHFGPLTIASMRAALGSASPEVAFARAEELGLDALLYRLSDTLGLELKPHRKLMWRAHLADVLARRVAMLGLLRDLCAHDPDLPILALKGEVLGERMFRDGLARRSSDIDVFVSRDHLERAGDAMRALGYVPVHGGHPEPWLYNQWAFADSSTGRIVEVHWALSSPEVPQPPNEVLIARREEIAFHRDEVSVLGRMDTFFHLCLHFHHHVGFAKGLFDVAGWVDSASEEELEEWLLHARRLGMRRITTWPLRAIERLSGQRVLPSPERDWLVEAWSLWTAWHIRGVLSDEVPIGGASALAFKTQEILHSQVAAWRLLSLSLHDSTESMIRGGIFIVMRSPEAIAQARGASRATIRDQIAWITRPARLLIKAARELL